MGPVPSCLQKVDCNKNIKMTTIESILLTLLLTLKIFLSLRIILEATIQSKFSKSHTLLREILLMIPKPMIHKPVIGFYGAFLVILVFSLCSLDILCSNNFSTSLLYFILTSFPIIFKEEKKSENQEIKSIYKIVLIYLFFQ